MILQVGVKVLLKNAENKILLLQRSVEKYADVGAKWDIVGGRIDIGAPLLENLQRETREETGLSIISTPKLLAAQDILKESAHVVRLTHVAFTEGEPVLDGEEHTAYKWVTFEELEKEENLDSYVRTLLKEGLLKENSWE